MPSSESYNPAEDLALFARISSGDEQAFEVIFHHYNAKLLPFVLSITKNREAAEEIMQEVFLKVWLHRATLTTIENPAAWLVRIASNFSLSYVQRQALHTRIVNKIADAEITDNNPGSSIESDIDVKTIQEHIADAINQLPEKRQQIYRLSREGGLNRKQIADKLGVSESTIKNQMSSALKSIQEHLEKHYGIYLPLFLLASFA